MRDEPLPLFAAASAREEATVSEVIEPAIRINRWFADHPDMVLGRHAITSEQYGEAYTCLRLGSDLETALPTAIERLPIRDQPLLQDVGRGQSLVETGSTNFGFARCAQGSLGAVQHCPGLVDGDCFHHGGSHPRTFAADSGPTFLRPAVAAPLLLRRAAVVRHQAGESPI